MSRYTMYDNDETREDEADWVELTIAGLERLKETDPGQEVVASIFQVIEALQQLPEEVEA
jgi:hypothetical protein